METKKEKSLEFQKKHWQEKYGFLRDKMLDLVERKAMNIYESVSEITNNHN